MSKHRPSSSGDTLLAARGNPDWSRRVFHNSYTRAGQTRRVRSWSVKLQYQGRRRTFSLAARTRAAAAQEACQLDAELREQGWDAVWPGPNRRPTAQPARSDRRYWRERLVSMPPVEGAKSTPEFSAWIEHEGAAHSFPLQSVDPEEAAGKALSLYHLVMERGWKAAFQVAGREVTLAFHWNANPFLCTYTTLQTIPDGLAGPAHASSGETQRKTPIFIAEPEASLYRALAQCLSVDALGGCQALPFGQASTSSLGAGICLLNRDYADGYGLSSADGLNQLPAGLVVIPYSVYPSSEELFRLAPGKLLGYCFKRLPAAGLLTPVTACLGSRPPRVEAMKQASWGFFQSWLQAPQNQHPSEGTVSLTGREREVLVLLSRGHVDKEIANALGISSWTVHEHVKRIFEKLQVHSRIEAALAYLKK